MSYLRRTVTTSKNAATAPNGTSSELLAASTAAERTAILKNTGDRTVYIAFGEAATTSKFPLVVGDTLKTNSLGAINGISASGTGAVFVLAEEVA